MIKKINQLIENSIRFNNANPNSIKDPNFLFLTAVLIAALFFSYSNHFSNTFHFDDIHTIQNNTAIQEINIERFFSDATTFSSMPENQTYRPLTTLQNAIDYKIGNGLNPRIYHLHIFLTFTILICLIYFFIKKLLDRLNFSEYNQFYALLNAAIFGLLCANTETVNYIIQRAEITAALLVLSGFVTFLYGGKWKRYYIYLVFPFIGFFAKEMALVFAPLLLLYILIFEQHVELLKFYTKNEFIKCLKSFSKALPAFIITIGFYLYYVSMTPSALPPGGQVPAGLNQFHYLITQPMVIVHYIITYFIPYNLSADPDWVVYTSIFDYRALTGIFIFGAILFFALKASKNKDTRLFSFGLLWFFISLIPTSSFIPFYQVSNDHRSFIPYIGLTIAFVFGMNYLFQKYLSNLLKEKHLKTYVIIGLVIFLGANVYGIRERNKVWRTDLSLWKDVSSKSPNNGRGHMNYGLALMSKGDYVNAEKLFLKALELTPNYPSLYINLGIVKNATGNIEEANKYFIKALNLSPSSHSSLYFYARFLANNNQDYKAKKLLNKSLTISPYYLKSQKLLLELYHKSNDWEKLTELSESILIKLPNNSIAKKYFNIGIHKKTVSLLLEEDALMHPTPEKYLNLSLHYFNNRKYEKTISSASQALNLRKDYADAYNNIGIAYYMLGEFDKAIEAYNSALTIKPDYNLAKSNLANTIEIKSLHERVYKDSGQKLTSNDFLNLSLSYYNKGNYMACIEAAQKSNQIKMNAGAFNNICASYNRLKMYDKAIEACSKALKLDSTNILAKGNLKDAINKNQ